MFLHGVMGSGINWRSVARAFESEFHVLTYDQRGHGRSVHPASGYHPRDFADDLRKILDELGWESVGLVGHSMGGRNALEFASHFSQRVKCLVLEDIGPDASSAAIGRIERLLDLVPVPFADREAVRRFFVDRYPALIAWYPQPEAVSRFLQSNIEQKPDGSFDWRFHKPGILQSLREGRNEDRWDAYRNLKMPVLIVRGEQSADLSTATFARMRAELPGVQATEIGAAGHWVHADQPAAFIGVLKEFFHTVYGANL